MVEESANNKENNTSSAAQNEQPKKQSAKDFIEGLFANDNYLCTMPKAKLPDGSALNINDETRRRLALFADGTLLISKDHRFDGPVLSFLSIAEKKGIKMKSPVYISQNELATIYAMAERNQVFSEDDEDLARLQMQRDFVNIIKRASSMKVSDVHVVVSDNCTEIFFRANGVMIKEMEYSKEWGDQFVRAAFASADISDANYAQNEFQGAQKLGSTPLRGSKGKLMLPHNVLAIRLQFNPIAFGSQYLVMRILYADDNPDGNDDLAALGCGEYEQDLFFRLRAAPVGLNIVAGPTGSGKSTLLQRNMIKLIKEKNGEINLLTVEDPPEYPIPGARQMPVTNANTEEEKTVQFTLALSAGLRSDPDVLMVGEIRSLATASLTFKGALSGHLVWATLHANSAPAIVTRLRDMGVQSYMLSDPELLKGLISQRLFRKLCPYCRVPVKERLDNPAVKRLRTALGDFGVENTYLKGPGCKFCEGRGIKGRLGVQEMILPDGTFLELMIAGETRKAIDYWTGDLNGRTLKDAALERMLKGLIDLDEVERWCGLLDQRPVY